MALLGLVQDVARYIDSTKELVDSRAVHRKFLFRTFLKAQADNGGLSRITGEQLRGMLSSYLRMQGMEKEVSAELLDEAMQTWDEWRFAIRELLAENLLQNDALKRWSVQEPQGAGNYLEP